MKSMFDAADTDADGTVSVADLRTAWSRCPRSAESALDEEAARRIIWHYNTKEGGRVEGLEYGDFVGFLQEGS
jgi:Ca2+-binding EF-hand superfamily protein